MTNLANNLIFYRKKNGLTQGQLGDLLHVSAQAISKWENGQAEPGLDMLLKLAEIYHVSTDALLSLENPAEEVPTAKEFPKSKKPSAFASFLRKRWYLILIAALLIAATAVCAVLFFGPKTHAEMIRNGDIFLGMTEAEARALLGDPTDLIAAEDYKNYQYSMKDSLNYGAASYYIYFEKREAKNDDELWFGVKYEFLRLVFNTDGELIEAFACATPSQNVWGYGDTEAFSMKEYKFFTNSKGIPTRQGTLALSDGSLYLGALSVSDGILYAELGEFKISSAPVGGNDGSIFTKTCYVCGEEKTDCKNDNRLTGEPEPVCRDCRDELDEFFEK